MNRAALLTLPLFFACQGSIGSMGERPADEPVVIPGDERQDTCSGNECALMAETPVPVTRIPRLSHSQWENTVTDLFRLDAPLGLSAEFDPDVNLASRFSASHERLFVSAGLWQDYQRAAEAVAATVTASPAYERWRGDDGRDEFLRTFAVRAVRRPVDDSLLASLATLYDEGAEHYPTMDADRAGARMVVEALLQTPSFLYRLELTPADELLSPLDDYELATRLAYFLWNSTPDEALLEAAAQGLDETRLRAQAERLLHDPRAARAVGVFHGEHFGINGWRGAERSTEAQPLWREGLHDEMHTSMVRFIRSVFERDEGVRELFTSRRAFVGPGVASVYGVEVRSANGLVEIELPAERAGMLTRAAFLTKYASSVTDPIHRGLFVHTRVLCQTLPPPPDEIEVPAASTSQTMRAAVEEVTHEGGCASCHEGQINPPGFALEGFGPIGELRREDNGFPVDTAARYEMRTGVALELQDAVSLSVQVAERREAHECYAAHLVEFALGRPRAGDDAPLVFRLTEGSQRGELSLRELMLEVAMSRSFRLRTRAELEEVSP
ncbi:MAG: DUF1592 domain-containing protein [Myxococcota bacterium]